jgi:hypothetical protein
MVRAFTKVIMEITLALTVLLNIGICICASGEKPLAQGKTS